LAAAVVELIPVVVGTITTHGGPKMRRSAVGRWKKPCLTEILMGMAFPTERIGMMIMMGYLTMKIVIMMVMVSQTARIRMMVGEAMVAVMMMAGKETAPAVAVMGVMTMTGMMEAMMMRGVGMTLEVMIALEVGMISAGCMVSIHMPQSTPPMGLVKEISHNYSWIASRRWLRVASHHGSSTHGAAPIMHMWVWLAAYRMS
jgi:hypothetical protein